MSTEIESRYLIPDRLLFDRLRRLDAIGPFRLKRRGAIKIVDYYLDTPGRAILHQGWACRLRSEGEKWLITLKGPKKVSGSIVSRPEFEITIPGRIEDVARWPRGRVRKQVTELTGGLPLRKLVAIRQTRHKFDLFDDLRPVAELSLDAVRTIGEGLRHRCYMVECELGENGREADLVRLDATLVGDFALMPESRSKLQRALELVERAGSPDEALIQSVPPSSVESVLQRYGVDLAHARHVAQLSARLYDLLQPVHQLGQEPAPLLRTAALLHDVGRLSADGPAHLVGRDLLLRVPIESANEDDQHILAAAAYLRRGTASPDRISEVIPADWSPDLRQRALVIAALVRMAAALDASGHQATHVHEASISEGTVRMVLDGPTSAKDATRAQRRSDLWEMLFPVRLEWGFYSEGKDEPPVYVKQAQNSLGIRPWDSMREAARKVLTFHLQRMLDHEAGTRLGEDPEELHDMRVATRRMRSALRLFGPFLGGSTASAANDQLRRAARVLGDVRDLDVAIARAQDYLESLPADEQVDLGPLLRRWQRRRISARRRLIRYLDAAAYQRLLRTSGALLAELAEPQAPDREQRPVSRVAPRFLYVSWRLVRAYDEALKDAPIELLHALRIDCKRLRYGLEFISDILPKQAVALVPQVISLQDHLGEMRDAAVTVEMLDVLLAGHRTPRYDGIRAYRDACQAEMVGRLKTFPKAWRRFSRRGPTETFAKLLTL